MEKTYSCKTVTNIDKSECASKKTPHENGTAIIINGEPTGDTTVI